ncbi:MAG TPA: hypothetical protein VIG90_19335 [Pedomonas sp.]|uniref:hypothetical protein n=1 Tax=Pedomonas sp. TaxID=2976421 RepID=UPI002F3FDBBD
MTNQSPSSVDPNKDKGVPDDCKKETVKRADEALDEAIEESFPASDPVSMVVDGPRVQPKECDFRPSDQHPETDHVAHPERDVDAKPQQDNEPMDRPEHGKGEHQQR